MAKTDILGTNKVRTKPEYVAKTHWAGSVNFAAIFTAPILYLILPVLVLYVTGCFKLLADFINKLAEQQFCNQYAVMGVVAVILWQFVVCWTVWRKEIKKYETAPQYEYFFYNDIVEYKRLYHTTAPKFIKTLRSIINFIPTLVAAAIGIAFIVLIIMYAGSAEPGPTPTPGNPGTSDPSVGTDSWSVIWGAISGFFKTIFGVLVAFATNKETQPIFVGIIVALVVIILVRLIVKLIKSLKNRKKSTINARTVPMRTLPAIISVVKKLPAPKYLIPDNCPRWLRKIIFWAPVRYNFGDVIISSPKGTDDDVVLSKIENPEELINYLSPIKPQPTEVASYSANR